LELTRFGGHPKTRESARGVIHVETEEKTVYGRVQGRHGAALPGR
jgi:hypothetical protein